MISPQYAQQCVWRLEELFGSISAEKKECLLSLLKRMENDDSLKAWCKKNCWEEVYSFAKATSKQRASKKKWSSDHDHFLLLTFYAFRLLEFGYKLLKVADSAPEHGSYSEVCAQYGLLSLDLEENLKQKTSFFEDVLQIPQ